MKPSLRKVVSGGQTGVDRAALDAAAECGLERGGWCPRGRLAEDGRIPEVYPLAETPSPLYRQRTDWNVRDSDGTLVLTDGPPGGGTALTLARARARRKQLHLVDLSKGADHAGALKWLALSGIEILNVAGPRESSRPGIYLLSLVFLKRVFVAPSP